MSTPATSNPIRAEHWYRAVWRWHFYAGLFCVPFVLWLSVTGGLYLFKPQIEAALYAPYRGVAQGPSLPAGTVAARAVQAVPGSILHKYVLPQNRADAVQVLVGKGAQEVRVWVHPETGAILHQVSEEDRLMRIVFHLHGELLAGNRGSALVETAACWTIVMLITGLFLWWPRKAKGLAGILYPRWRKGRTIFWRDIHAVTGLWITVGAVFLIVSGLPWANAWGNYFRTVRVVTGTSEGRQDWSSGSNAEAAKRADDDAAMRAVLAGPPSGHASHHATSQDVSGRGRAEHATLPSPASLTRVVEAASALDFAAPVEVSAPTAKGAPWRVNSQADNRPRRDSAEIAADGSLVGIERFADRHWIDRAVGYGVAVHEGAWAGLANQLVNLAVLLGLVLLCLSSMVLWWQRRPIGTLGAPEARAPLRHSWALVLVVLILAIVMPLFGVSLALAVVMEAAIKRIYPFLREWMGWRASPAPD